MSGESRDLLRNKGGCSAEWRLTVFVCEFVWTQENQLCRPLASPETELVSAAGLKIQNGKGEKRATRRNRFVVICPRSEVFDLQDRRTLNLASMLSRDSLRTGFVEIDSEGGRVDFLPRLLLQSHKKKNHRSRRIGLFF
ncbi:hypothetical protein TNCV_523521 [Trichonephila clavipes]|nr:hypothetical protein TNCV_523521 [Trichonephila clavipes]